MKKIAIVSSLLVLSLALGALVTSGAFAEDKPQSSVTGTIVKMTSDDIVLQTDQGEMKFDMDKKTEKPAALAVGSKVTISYDSDDQGKHEMDARKIEMYTEPAPAPSAAVQAPPPVQETTPPPVTSTPPQEQTQTTTEPAPLPKTASPLPFVGALGLLSLLGGSLLLRQPK